MIVFAASVVLVGAMLCTLLAGICLTVIIPPRSVSDSTAAILLELGIVSALAAVVCFICSYKLFQG